MLAVCQSRTRRLIPGCERYPLLLNSTHGPRLGDWVSLKSSLWANGSFRSPSAPFFTFRLRNS